MSNDKKLIFRITEKEKTDMKVALAKRNILTQDVAQAFVQSLIDYDNDNVPKTDRPYFKRLIERAHELRREALQQ